MGLEMDISVLIKRLCCSCFIYVLPFCGGGFFYPLRQQIRAIVKDLTVVVLVISNYSLFFRPFYEKI